MHIDNFPKRKKFNNISVLHFHQTQTKIYQSTIYTFSYKPQKANKCKKDDET